MLSQGYYEPHRPTASSGTVTIPHPHSLSFDFEPSLSVHVEADHSINNMITIYLWATVQPVCSDWNLVVWEHFQLIITQIIWKKRCLIELFIFNSPHLMGIWAFQCLFSTSLLLLCCSYNGAVFSSLSSGHRGYVMRPSFLFQRIWQNMRLFHWQSHSFSFIPPSLLCLLCKYSNRSSAWCCSKILFWWTLEHSCCSFYLAFKWVSPSRVRS